MYSGTSFSLWLFDCVVYFCIVFMQREAGLEAEKSIQYVYFDKGLQTTIMQLKHLGSVRFFYYYYYY